MADAGTSTTPNASPAPDPTPPTPGGWRMVVVVLAYYAAVLLAAVSWAVPARAGLYLLVVLAGALGGVLHGLTSLAAHAGAGRLELRWWPFYAARPVVGGGLALLVVLVLRGGLLGITVPPADQGDRVLLAWAAFAGLFSSPALKKLEDVFDGIWGNGAPGPKHG